MAAGLESATSTSPSSFPLPPVLFRRLFPRRRQAQRRPLPQHPHQRAATQRPLSQTNPAFRRWVSMTPRKSWVCASPTGDDDQAFLYTNGAFQTLRAQANAAVAHALSDSGIIAGRFTTRARARNAFLYQNGTLRDLGTISVYRSVRGVNAKAQVVGSSTFGDAVCSRPARFSTMERPSTIWERCAATAAKPSPSTRRRKSRTVANRRRPRFTTRFFVRERRDARHRRAWQPGATPFAIKKKQRANRRKVLD